MKKICLLDVIMILVIAFMIAAVAYGFFGLHEVETYTFHATVTNMEMVKHADGLSTFSHYIYWCDGALAGYDKVPAHVYAQYREGDLIEITSVIEEDWFDNVFESFEIRG